jgi:hypothetical protein
MIEEDPESDPDLYLTLSEPDPGGQKHPDPQHCSRQFRGSWIIYSDFAPYPTLVSKKVT